jgi:hypothetical protein
MPIKIKVLIAVSAYQKMCRWVDMAQGEVSGLGTVNEGRDASGRMMHYIVDDVFLLKQDSGGVNTVLDDQAVGEFLIEMAKAGNDLSSIKLWWHSHGPMEAFWSGTDEACIANLANSGGFVSIVTNKARKVLTRIDIFHPFQFTVNEVPTDIYTPDDPQLDEFCKKEFKKKVKEHTNASTPTYREMYEPMPFPGRGDVDREIETLEDLVASGKISVDEYERRVQELDLEYAFD